MRIKKSLLVAGAVATIGLAGTGAVAHAATKPDPGKDGLVDKIAQKFSLNRDDVQKVFDEERQSHEAEHQAKVEERLTKAVTDGKITEEQKSKILAKLTELKSQMQTNHEALKDKTKEERKALMDQKQAELKQWAQDNNIPTGYLPMAGPGKGSRGPGKPGDGGDVHVHIENDSNTN